MHWVAWLANPVVSRSFQGCLILLVVRSRLSGGGEENGQMNQKLLYKFVGSVCFGPLLLTNPTWTNKPVVFCLQISWFIFFLRAHLYTGDIIHILDWLWPKSSADCFLMITRCTGYSGPAWHGWGGIHSFVIWCWRALAIPWNIINTNK